MINFQKLMIKKKEIQRSSCIEQTSKKINIMCLIASSPSLHSNSFFLWVCASENFIFPDLCWWYVHINSMVNKHELIDASLETEEIIKFTYFQSSWIHHIHWVWNLWVVSVEAKKYKRNFQLEAFSFFSLLSSGNVMYLTSTLVLPA